ncbi:hypothetical protein H8B02_40615 [Bradyrhizobium sp. Pear77]|nr:hypothetical protein [Bradyrhizobium altum]
MFFSATGLTQELLDVLADIRIVLMATIGGPKSYDVSGPIEVSVYEGFPGATKGRWDLPVLKLDGVREYFEWIGDYGRAQLDRFEALRKRAHQGFDELPDGGDAAFAETRKYMVEEMPIRSFKEDLGQETYDKLIQQRVSETRLFKPNGR